MPVELRGVLQAVGRDARGRRITATFDGMRATVMVDQLQWARFDLAGRWTAGLVRGETRRRALSGRVLTIRSTPMGRERFHEVSACPEADAIHDTVREWASSALELPEVAPWRDVLERAARLGPAELAADGARFSSIYPGAPIVPPDRTQDLLLQSTIGCKHNGCTFCELYPGLRYRMRTASDFASHVEMAVAHLGPALRGKRGVFLGDASAITGNVRTLMRHLEVVRDVVAPRLAQRLEHAPGHPWHAPMGAVRAFCDAFMAPMRTVEELAALARLGLHRVYLGVETGSDDLLAFLRKPATRANVLELSLRLSAAGIRQSVLIMPGVGGRRFATRHLEETVSLLGAMPLRSGDAVVFSEFFPLEGSAYALEGLEALTRMECREQMRAMMGRLGLPSRTGPRVSMYDARQLLY